MYCCIHCFVEASSKYELVCTSARLPSSIFLFLQLPSCRCGDLLLASIAFVVSSKIPEEGWVMLLPCLRVRFAARFRSTRSECFFPYAPTQNHPPIPPTTPWPCFFLSSCRITSPCHVFSSYGTKVLYRRAFPSSITSTFSLCMYILSYTRLIFPVRSVSSCATPDHEAPEEREEPRAGGGRLARRQVARVHGDGAHHGQPSSRQLPHRGGLEQPYVPRGE